MELHPRRLYKSDLWSADGKLEKLVGDV